MTKKIRYIHDTEEYSLLWLPAWHVEGGHHPKEKPLPGQPLLHSLNGGDHRNSTGCWGVSHRAEQSTESALIMHETIMSFHAVAFSFAPQDLDWIIEAINYIELLYKLIAE